MWGCASTEIATKYSEDTTLYLLEISDNSSEGWIMNYWTRGISNNSLRISFVESLYWITNIGSRMTTFWELLKCFWCGKLTHKDRNTINKFVITRTDVDLLRNIQSGVDWSHSCRTNKELNAISAEVFKQHALNTNPSVESHYLPPPDYTTVIEIDTQTSTKLIPSIIAF